MAIVTSINVHLEHDTLEVTAHEMPHNNCAYLVLSQGAGYGELNIFFRHSALAEVQEIARLLKRATTRAPKEETASEPAEEEVVF